LARIVLHVPNDRKWDVTVGCRIERVTDHEAFPDLLRAALANEDSLSVVQFDRPNWPHTTSVIVRLTAINKKDAERRGKEILLPLLLTVASDIIDDEPFGWTLRVDAEPASHGAS